ncbi:MAG TPA: MarR family transcriptional regulator [Azospirillaceae bacterium]|nr:MarR family transcriptional regulator [Azospirillaceae bacterium]
MEKRHATVGVTTPEDMKARLYAAARGEQAFDPDGPKVWMTVDALMRLLTKENRDLLAVIEHERPRSVSALAERMGREQGNVSRTIAKLERAGLVRLVPEGREKRPEVVIKHLRIDLDLGEGRCDIVEAA